jgi:hypothetical protein
MGRSKSLVYFAVTWSPRKFGISDQPRSASSIVGLSPPFHSLFSLAHGFTNPVGRMQAANQALDAVGAFLKERLAGARQTPEKFLEFKGEGNGRT